MRFEGEFSVGGLMFFTSGDFKFCEGIMATTIQIIFNLNR